MVTLRPMRGGFVHALSLSTQIRVFSAQTANKCFGIFKFAQQLDFCIPWSVSPLLLFFSTSIVTFELPRMKFTIYYYKLKNALITYFFCSSTMAERYTLRLSCSCICIFNSPNSFSNISTCNGVVLVRTFGLVYN